MLLCGEVFGKELKKVSTLNGQTGLGKLCKSIQKQFDTMCEETDRKRKEKEK